MDFQTLYELIENRPVVLDENMLFSNLLQFLTTHKVAWRQFRKGMTDEDIMRHLLPNEIVITADRRFAYKLGDKAILVPLHKSQIIQIQHLEKAFNKSGLSLYADIKTCPICTNHNDKDEFSWWDFDHMERHSRNPYVSIRKS